MSNTKNIVIADLNNKLNNMVTIETLNEWRERLNTIHNEIEHTVNSEFDSMILQDQFGNKPISEQDFNHRESIRYRRHAVHNIESCIDCIDLCISRAK